MGIVMINLGQDLNRHYYQPGEAFLTSHKKVKTMNRRDFMRISGAAAGLALIPACNLATAADLPLVTADDPTGKALGYVAVSTIAGSSCANCSQSKGDAGAKTLGCNIFPGKQVHATGWCKVWAKKA